MPIERRALALRVNRAYPARVTNRVTTRAEARQADAAEALQVRLSLSDELFRVGLSRLLAEEGIEVVNDAPADAVVVDLGRGELPSESDERIVALCGVEESGTVEALGEGAAAVVWRGSEPGVIASAIRAAVGGAVVMPAATASRLLWTEREVRTDEDTGRQVLESLSVRELEVLSLVASGFANDEIAEQLVVTASTVKNHLARIMAKLGARNRTHAAVLAARLAS
jgi:DNA-binding CsgD family transcriptional regulator